MEENHEKGENETFNSIQIVVEGTGSRKANRNNDGFDNLPQTNLWLSTVDFPHVNLMNHITGVCH